MSEWWTYGLSDFLMFSPATWQRLVESYNRETWPLHLLLFGAGLVMLWLAASPRPSSAPGVALVLAALWLWVGWAFHWQRYAAINWAAGYFAGAFAVQAALLLVAAGWGAARDAPAADVRMRRTGVATAACGVLIYPLAGLAAGRPWSQVEVFGLMPEPTALASLGLLLATAHRPWLFVIPGLSLAVGWATQWALLQ